MENLKIWTREYIKHRDLVQKKIQKITEEKDKIIVQQKDKTINYYITEIISPENTLILGKDTKIIVCPNNIENYTNLTKKWNKWIAVPNLTIIFVNMKTHEKWQINPKIHHMIADSDSIEQGLKTMFDTANGNINDIPKTKKSMFESDSKEE